MDGFEIARNCFAIIGLFWLVCFILFLVFEWFGFVEFEYVPGEHLGDRE